MDTVVINSNDSYQDEGEGKKKNKISDTTKAAIATGVAGVAAGAAAKTIFDAKTYGDSEEQITETANQAVAEEQEIIPIPEIENDPIVEINPEDVMLEEPVPDVSIETDMIAEPQPETGDGDEQEYEPFANNDTIVDEVVTEPTSEDVYIAQNTEEDIEIGEEDVIVDTREELPTHEIETFEENLFSEDFLLADSTSPDEDYDIQTDLMA